MQINNNKLIELKLYLFFFVTLNRMTKYTWGVCLCFWVVCSLNHRGAESEESNWIFGCSGQEVLACRFVCDVTYTSASFDTKCSIDSAFGTRITGVSVSMSTHTFVHCIWLTLSLASFFIRTYVHTSRYVYEWCCQRPFDREPVVNFERYSVFSFFFYVLHLIINVDALSVE